MIMVMRMMMMMMIIIIIIKIVRMRILRCKSLSVLVNQREKKPDQRHDLLSLPLFLSLFLPVSL